MIEFSYSNPNSCTDYFKLYNRCFKKYPSTKNPKYLNWLYNENPVGKFIGIDAYEDNQLIGQVGGIPQNFNLNGEKIKILQAMNVCVDPKYRGQNLFSKMAGRLLLLAKEERFSHMIAVANKLASKAWKKSIDPDMFFPLEAVVGYGDLDLKKKKIDDNFFFQIWDSNSIKWRVENPHNPVKTSKTHNKIKLYSSTFTSFIKVFGYLNDYNYKLNFEPIKNNFLPNIFIGLIPGISKKYFLNIPDFLKPSPLNFIIKNLNDKNNSIKKELIYFSYLDFDAY